MNHLNMVAVGLKGKAMPKHYKSETKAKFKPWGTRLHISVDHKPKDSDIFPVTVSHKKSTEYKSNFSHKSILNDDRSTKNHSEKDFKESVIPVGHVIKPWSKPSQSMEKTTQNKEAYRGASIDYLQTRSKKEAIKQLYFLTRNGISNSQSRIHLATPCTNAIM
jgi:hypothetical protein